MLLLNLDQTLSASGGYIFFDIDGRISTQNYQSQSWTIKFDGSLPPELQSRIDSGESFDSMKGDLRDYVFMMNTLQTFHPELFTKV